MTPKAREDSASPDGAEEGVVALANDPHGPDADDAALAAAEARSLFEDLEVLIEDGKTYLEAELNFQKTRGRFVADRARRALVFGSVAVLLILLAAIGLTVGLTIALAPLLTAWGATALVAGVLGAAAVLAGRAAIRRGKELAQAFASSTDAKQ